MTEVRVPKVKQSKIALTDIFVSNFEDVSRVGERNDVIFKLSGGKTSQTGAKLFQRVALCKHN